MLSAYLKRNGSNGSGGKKEKDRTAHYELRYCPVPSLKGYPPNTILVRTIAASICGSDLFGLGGCPSCPEWRRPTSLFDVMPEKCGGSGHEAIGIIVDMIPPLSSEMSIGQNVAGKVMTNPKYSSADFLFLTIWLKRRQNSRCKTRGGS